MKAKKRLSQEALILIAARFRVLGEPARLQLLQELMSGSKSVQELCEETGLGQANVSKHMALLAENGIVARRKEGLFSIYSIADSSVFEMCDAVCGALQARNNSEQRKLRGS